MNTTLSTACSRNTARTGTPNKTAHDRPERTPEDSSRIPSTEGATLEAASLATGSGLGSLRAPTAVARSGRQQTLETATVRAGLESDRHHGAVVPPLHLSSTFTFEGFDRPRQYDYTRSGNPTRDALADALAQLEGGAGCTVTGSGMSAVTLATQLLEPGARLVAPHDCYGGTHRLLTRLHEREQLVVEFVDARDSEALSRAVGRGARAIWVETPSNPLLRVTDIAAVAGLARDAGALLIVDNTFLSPALQRPIELGADLVVHSTTKYINGHSDVVGGAVIARTSELAQEVSLWANTLGLSGSPFDSYLTLRGLRTLHSRWRIHEDNAQRVVQLLETHPAVAETLHPSLAAHPEHALAARQQEGFGAMVSLKLHGGVSAVRTFVENLQTFSLAESLGGVESLVAHPATMTHASMPADARQRAGICDQLVRLSVGLESADDLCRDLQGALDLAAKATELERGPRALVL